MPMHGKKAQPDPFDPLTNHIGAGSNRKTQAVAQKAPIHTKTYSEVNKDLTEEQKAQVFRRFDLNMIALGSEERSEKDVWCAAHQSDQSPLPLNFESVDVLAVGNETSI